MNTQTADNKQATLTIGGMACSGCAGTVQNALNEINGVEKASADHEKGTASVSYDQNSVTTDDFKQAIEGAGYEFKGLK